MPGPVIATPPGFDAMKRWTAESPSVFDAPLERAMRQIASVLGVDDPLSQVLGIMAPLEAPAQGAAGALAKAAGRIREKIRAFHGSPHDFDKFSLSKIGTGEGAQAYGHGLYFAENEGVAKEYRDALAGHKVLVDGKPWAEAQGLTKNQRAAFDYMERYNMKPSDLNDGALGDAYRYANATGSAKDFARFKADWHALGARVEQSDPRGKLYEVAIDASPDELLDWDAPLSQQPPKVQEALGKLWQERGGTLEGRTLPPFAAHSEATGESAYAAVSTSFAPKRGGNEAAQKAGAEALQRHGVKGIRYRDAMSRDGSGEGTRNLVVFDDSLVDIIRKYGVAVATAAGYTKQQIDAAQAAQGAPQQ